MPRRSSHFLPTFSSLVIALSSAPASFPPPPCLSYIPFVVPSPSPPSCRSHSPLVLLPSLHRVFCHLLAGKGEMRTRKQRRRPWPHFATSPVSSLSVYRDSTSCSSPRSSSSLFGPRVPSAFSVFGTLDKVSVYKKDYLLPTAKITNPDKRPWQQMKNPLFNKALRFRLNPFTKTIRRHENFKQEHLKKKNVKKSKQPVSAGKVFTAGLFAP
ncbi:hypothetical protein C8J57DRAFT_1536482 [Mycena rebaudengoi]|nr:hypothetical protein C8J57DRAFT_1536482 [Mycena rebaudengoi]